ncbi:MAG: hypothetical protein V3U84_02465 [Thiotrichaceae bacterium]
MLKSKLLTLLHVSIMGLLVLGSSNLAAKQGHIKLTSQVQKVITVKTEQGKLVNKLIVADKVLPGEVVQYTNTFVNISAEGADNIGITNPIPKHTVYIPNTAKGDNFNIIYSVDGGKNWEIPSKLKIKNSDGSLRNAKPTDYTHIRWKYKTSLSPNEKKSVSYQVRLL